MKSTELAQAPANEHRLARVLRSLVEEQTVETVLQRLASELRELVPSDCVVIWGLLDDGRLAPMLIDGEREDELNSLQVELGSGITGTAVLTQRLIVANDAHVDPRAAHIPNTRRDPEAIVCVPLTARDHAHGGLSLYRRGERRDFLAAELELVRQFADIAAIALHNAKTLAELERLAATDDLTGLANRRCFHRELRQQAAAAERHQIPLSLLLLDLDNFKQINDQYGHDAGDRVLRSVASTLKSRVRASDIVARIGGDEFAILLPHTDQEAAAQLARALAAQLERAVQTPLSLRASIGIASSDDTAYERLLSEADRLLYVEKRKRQSVA